MRTARSLLRMALVLLGLAPAAAWSQELLLTAGQKPEDKTPTVKLVLRPAAPPAALMKYRLVPSSVSDCQPGNAAVHYNKVAMLLPEQDRQKNSEKIADWLNKPFDKFPRAEAAKLLAGYKQALNELDVAARRDHCDWDLAIRERNFITLLLPEVQKLREYGRLIALKARLEIAEGQFDAALHDLQTGLALARHTAQGPTLISGLVGIAIANQMMDQIRELVEQPNVPNLYWSLTAMPRPLVDMRPGIEAETDLLALGFPEVRKADFSHLDQAYWQHWLDHFDKLWTDIEAPLPETGVRPMLTAFGLMGYPRAKQALIDQGRSPEEVEAMPVTAVLALYSIQTYDELRDREFRWFYVPYWEAKEGLAKASEDLRAECLRREVYPLASLLLPAATGVMHQAAKSERQVAALRTVEALRLYAYEHDGRLPDQLTDIHSVPLPTDPMTGRPIAYHRTGDTAVLESPPPVTRTAADGLRWEIRVQPLKK